MRIQIAKRRASCASHDKPIRRCVDSGQWQEPLREDDGLTFSSAQRQIPPSSGRRSKPTRPHLTWASPATPSSRTRLSRGLGISSGLVFNAPFGGQPACNCRSRPRPPLFLDVVQSCQYADRLAPPQSRLDGPAILQEDRGETGIFTPCPKCGSQSV